MSEEFWSTYPRVTLFVLALIAWMVMTVHLAGRGEDARSTWGCAVWRTVAVLWFTAGASALVTLGAMNG